MKQRYSKRIGNSGENLVQSTLYSRGFLIPERIETPFVRIYPTNPRLKKMGLYKIAYSEPVSGDHRAVLPNGGSVLVESKTYLGSDRLQFSKLRKHQPERLAAHAAIPGAVSILAWVTDWGVMLLKWPIIGFHKGKSLMLENAQKWNINEVNELAELGGWR